MKSFMAGDNPSEFGLNFTGVPQDSAEAQFTPVNICGEGAGGTVYRVRLNGLLVAVKRLSEKNRLNAAFIAAYRKEFEIGRRLRHIALPVYRELRADAGEVYIVMDFVDGVTVDNFLGTPEGKAYFRNEHNLRDFLSQILNVLSYLHRNGVVHCDLKPANLMLRHSDGSVMLIDLDKAYCDTHDLTHGGTPGISDAVSDHCKPTAAKDFAALGRVMDVIYGPGNKSAPHGFRRFRKLCDQPDISAAKLREALEASPRFSKKVVITVAALIVSIITGGILYTQTIKTASGGQREVAEYGEVQPGRDTVAAAAIPDETGSATFSVSRPPDDAHRNHDRRIIDFDSRMERYIRETVSAQSALRTGKLTDTEIQDLATRVSDLYSSTYDEIIEEHRKNYPEASEADVYRDVVEALGNSRTFKIMQAFSKELVDTVNARLDRLDALHAQPH